MLTLKQHIVRTASKCVLWIIGLLLCDAQLGHSHSGHENISEAEFGHTINADPRFYAVGPYFEGILIFPQDDADPRPRLFLLNHSGNEPVTSASIKAEVLSSPASAVEVEPGDLPGEYRLNHFTGETTSTLSAEISTGEKFEILNFVDIIVPGMQSSLSGPLHPSSWSWLSSKLIIFLSISNFLLPCLCS